MPAPDTKNMSFATLNWDKNEDVAAFIAAQAKPFEDASYERRRQGEINIAFYRGHQELRWHTKMRRLIRFPNPDNRVRLVINMVQPLINGYIAKIGMDKVQWEALPATEDQADFDTARLATAVLDYYADLLDVESMADETDNAAVITGQTFMKVCWDADAGEDAGVLDAQEVGFDAETFRREFGADSLDLKTGDLKIYPLSIFNVHWWPVTRPFEEADVVMEVNERSVSYAMQRYGLKYDEIEKAYSDRDRLLRPGGASGFGFGQDYEGESANTDTCLIKEIWVRANPKSKKLAEGRHIVMVGSKVVLNEKNPYRHRKIPIVSWCVQRPPACSRGETFVDQLIAPQADLNKNVSQQCENRELMGNPVWMAQAGSIANMDEWVARPGGIRQYRGIKPDLVQGATMPTAVIVMMKETIKFMQDIVGLHDVSQAKVPTGVKSGRAIAMLKESDDERMAPIARRRAKFWERVGSLALQTLAQYVTEERLIRILGDEDRWESMRFTGKNLVGGSGQPGVTPYDVRIRSHGVPRSRATRQEAMMFLVERGFFDPKNPEDREKVIEALELGYTQEPNDSTKKDRMRQRKECDLMSAGQWCEPQMYEDHELHLLELNRYRKRDDFLTRDPQVQMMFEQHEIAHLKLMATRQLKLQTITQQAIMEAQAQMGMLPAPAGPVPPPDGGQAAPPVDNGVEQSVVGAPA